VTEEIDKNDSVNMAVRMVAYSDERTVWKRIQDILVLDFVTQSQIIQDSAGKDRSFV
jgi:hypothetical protein